MLELTRALPSSFVRLTQKHQLDGDAVRCVYLRHSEVNEIIDGIGETIVRTETTQHVVSEAGVQIVEMIAIAELPLTGPTMLPLPPQSEPQNLVRRLRRLLSGSVAVQLLARVPYRRTSLRTPGTPRPVVQSFQL